MLLRSFAHRHFVQLNTSLTRFYSIKVGDKIPEFTFATMKQDKPTSISTSELFSNKKVVLFGVPGAFTPGCSKTHCPSFVLGVNQLKQKGIDDVYCTSVNDVFVMDAWSKSQNADGKITFLADSSGQFAKKLGLEFDLTEKGLGIRSKRYAMVVDDGIVKILQLDESGAVEKSTADNILKLL